MDLRRVGASRWLVGLAGLVLLISLWLPWYGAEGRTINAWNVLTFVDLILAFTALVAIALVLVAASQRAAALPLVMSRFLFWLALIAAILAVYRVISIPGVDILLAGGATHATRKVGVFIGALAAIALFVFAWRSKNDTSFAGPLRTHPEIETLPPPDAPARR